MDMKIDTQLLSRITGAPVSALEKKAIDEYKQQESTDEDIYLEGIIIDDSFLNGYDGFISPSGLREKLTQSKGDINLYIDSPGGSVFAASNMLTQVMKLRNEGRKVNVIVSGLAASAATYFLLEADSTQIAPMGMIMVHRAWTCACGDTEDFSKVAGLLGKMDTQYVERITALTGKDNKDVMAAVNEETWFTGEEAVDFGLVDGLYDAPAKGGDTPNNFRMLINQLSDFQF